MLTAAAAVEAARVPAAAAASQAAPVPADAAAFETVHIPSSVLAASAAVDICPCLLYRLGMLQLLLLTTASIPTAAAWVPVSPPYSLVCFYI